MNYYWIDPKRKIKKTYKDLLLDINNKHIVSKYIKIDNPYEIFLEIICSMIYENDIVLLDSDFSMDEIRNLGVDKSDLDYMYINPPKKISNISDLYKLLNLEIKWKLELYTSGTTGRPKKIRHSFDSLVRQVKRGDKFNNNIWGFSYNPTHFAGLQVFYQAFLNQNTIVYLFDQEKKLLEQIFNEYSITNISGTPTFYRNALFYFSQINEKVQRVTCGGEKFDTNLIKTVNNIFPKAKLRNVYASTEAGSLFGGESDMFEIKSKIKDKIKISENLELLVHKSLLGESDEFVFEDDWYNTGDLVELIGETKIRFTARKTEMINVGGYKVNPYEIEDKIRCVDGVLDVIVKGKKNKITGNILVAEVVKIEDSKSDLVDKKIISELSISLQPWKIPRIITFVDFLSLSRTGKKDRR